MRTLKTNAVIDVLAKSGIQPSVFMIGDGSYVMPTVSWIKDRFSIAFREFLEHLDTQVWKPEKNDCENFARGAAFFASVLHTRTSDVESEIAFGEFWYVKDPSEPHAINVILSLVIHLVTSCRCSLSHKTKQSLPSHRMKWNHVTL